MKSLVMHERHIELAVPPSGGGLARNVTPRRYVTVRTGGDLIVKAATARVLAAIRHTTVEQSIEDLYAKRRDERLMILVKSAATIADTTTGGWANELVTQDVQAFLASLPLSVYGALAQRGFTVDLAGVGSVSVPFRSGGTTDLAGAFVGENGAIPVKRTTLGSATLGRHKMAVISVLTQELHSATGAQTEAIIRQLMQDDTAHALDSALLDGAASVPGTRPAAINAGIAALPASAASSRAERIADDVGAIVEALVAAGCTGPFLLAMNDAQRISMTLACPGAVAVDVVVSPNITPGNVFGIDVSQFATAASIPEFDVSNSATLVMADAGAIAPTHATSAADATAVGTSEQVPPDGGINVSNAAQAAAGKAGENAVAVSMFQTYSLALRTLLPCSWTKGRAGSVQWVEGVAW